MGGWRGREGLFGGDRRVRGRAGERSNVVLWDGVGCCVTRYFEAGLTNVMVWGRVIRFCCGIF